MLYVHILKASFFLLHFWQNNGMPFDCNGESKKKLPFFKIITRLKEQKKLLKYLQNVNLRVAAYLQILAQ